MLLFNFSERKLVFLIDEFSYHQLILNFIFPFSKRGNCQNLALSSYKFISDVFSAVVILHRVMAKTMPYFFRSKYFLSVYVYVFVHLAEVKEVFFKHSLIISF